MNGRILAAQRMPKKLFTQGMNLGTKTIEPSQVQQLLQSGTGFKIQIAPTYAAERKEINPIAKSIIELLKKSHPELNKKTANMNDLRKALFISVKKEVPEQETYEEFAAEVINKLKQNPKIEKEIEILDFVINKPKDNFNGVF